jgi:hypothetical protein
MDVLDLRANRDMAKYFVDLLVPCPSSICDGFLTEYDEEAQGQGFKAFIMCPKCESRLRIWKKDKGWAEAQAPIVIGKG